MKKHAFLKSCFIVLFSISILFLSISNLNAQSVEADFLLYSPSPVITGMGGAGTAIPIDDPYNFFYNPAQLGLSSTNNNLSIGIYPSSVNLSANTEILFDNYAINGGYDLSELLGGFPLSIGAGFMYQGIDFGEYLKTDESGVVLGRVNPYEKATTFSLGFGFNYFIRIAGGISYKLIWSDMNVSSYTDSMLFSTKGNADAFDIGLLVEIPIITKLSLGEKFNLNLSASAGYTFANWGSDMVYTINNNDFGEPIARTTRLGYGLSAGIDYKYKETEFKLLQIDWTSEANDLLAKSRIVDEHDSVFSLISYNSSAPFGEINFWDNVVMLNNTSASTVNRHGVRVSLFETADISFGGYSKPHPHIKSSGSTLGFSIGTKGVMKFLSQEIKNDIIEFIAKHISLQYSYSIIKFNKAYYLNDIIIQYPDQKYNALYLVISKLW